ncbi:MAG: Gfo/Idh/MocA family oxidoreductase, partial [Planctomycetota bacterium]
MSLNVAVIGCGNISQFHFSGFEKAGANVTWVCDLDETAAARWAEATGARITSDYTEVMADPAVQLVDITAF